MKYINTFKKFFEKLNIENDDNEQVMSLKTNINEIEETIRTYKSNKSKLDNIYDTFIDNDDLIKKLKSSNMIDKTKNGISYTNELLSIYSSIPRNKRKIKDLSESIKKINDNITEISSDKNIEESEKKEKITTLKNEIIDKKNNINQIKKEIFDNESKMKDKFKELELNIKDKSNKLKNNF